MISRRGLLSLLTQGIKGDKEIRMHQISAVRFKRAGLALNGYIEITFFPEWIKTLATRSI